MMGQFEQLDQMLTEQEGMLRTSQVVSSGISKPVFYDYVRSRDLDRVAHGIYLSKDSWVDAMYLLHLRFEQAVFSHETALFFHDLTDREPIEYTVTVKTGCNPSKMKAEGIQVFTIKADLHDVGLTTAKTPFGHAKTREVYVAYRKAGYSKKFREEHEEEILLHQAAKNAFDEMGVKKLPKVKELQTEYAKLLEEKKKTYAEYRRSREEMRELLTAKANVDRVLKMEVEQDVEKEKDHGQR